MNYLYLIPIVLIVAFILADQLIRRRAYAKVEQMYNAKQYDELIAYLDTTYPRIFFPTFNRAHTLFNIYTAKGDKENAEKTLEDMLTMKCSPEQRLDTNLKAFDYHLSNAKYKKAQEDLERMNSIEGGKAMYADCKKLYEIVAEKSTAYMDEMVERLEKATPAEGQRLAYMLALQYKNAGQPERADEIMDMLSGKVKAPSQN